MTLQEVLDDLAHQLDWRGPSGKQLGYIVITREEAVTLVREIATLQLQVSQSRLTGGNHG